MGEIRFTIRTTSNNNLEEISCLGEQLAQILTSIIEETKNYSWYVFDTDYYNAISNELFTSPICRIDSTIKLIDKVKQVDQFLSGVFIAIDSKKIVNWDVNCFPITEEKEGIQNIDAELEIRAFDTTYFEIYCINSLIENKLKTRFASVI